jgi:hypothetical protein
VRINDTSLLSKDESYTTMCRKHDGVRRAKLISNQQPRGRKARSNPEPRKQPGRGAMRRTVPAFVHCPLLGRNTAWGDRETLSHCSSPLGDVAQTVQGYCALSPCMRSHWLSRYPCENLEGRLQGREEAKRRGLVAVALVSRRMPSTCGSKPRFVELTEAGGWNLCGVDLCEVIITRISNCFVGPEMPSNIDMMEESRR